MIRVELRDHFLGAEFLAHRRETPEVSRHDRYGDLLPTQRQRVQGRALLEDAPHGGVGQVALEEQEAGEELERRSLAPRAAYQQTAPAHSMNTLVSAIAG